MAWLSELKDTEMFNSCLSSLDPTQTVTTLPRAPGRLFVGQKPPLQTFPCSLYVPSTETTELPNFPPSLSLSLPLSAPSLWPCSVLPLPSRGGSPKCSFCSWHLHRFFSAFPVDMTHLTSTHSHGDSGLQGPIQRKSFHLPQPSPLLPLSKNTAISCPRECQDPTGTSLAAEKGGGGVRRESWKPLSSSPPFPRLFGACTASNPIYLLSVLWTPAINRDSDSIFFKNKHQTLLPQAQKSTPWLGQGGDIVCRPLTLVTGALKDRGGLERSLEVRQVG